FFGSLISMYRFRTSIVLGLFFFFISILSLLFSFFFFNHPATTEIYTLSLHDALPISFPGLKSAPALDPTGAKTSVLTSDCTKLRSEEHTSELQSHLNLVCRLLLEKKKKKKKKNLINTTYKTITNIVNDIKTTVKEYIT